MLPGKHIYIILTLFISLSGMQEAFSVHSESRDTLKKGPHSAVQKWTAAELWSQSVSRNLRLSGDDIVLDGNVLIEDDAAGIGSIRREAWDTISAGVVLRKYLTIGEWPVKDAVIAMMLYPVPPTQLLGGGKIEFTVNGRPPLVYEVRHFWTSVPVPDGYLRAGENVIEVKVHGSTDKYRVPLALYSNYRYGSSEGPPTSVKSERSRDNGRTWTRLAAAGREGAEYPVRLKLHTYSERAWLQTPVIGLAQEAAEGVLLSPSVIESASFTIDTAEASGSKWITRIRSGRTPVPEAGGWTGWQALEGGILPAEHRNRFIQLEFGCEANSVDGSPRLRGLNIESRWRQEIQDRISIIKADKGSLVRSSFDFRHEDPAYPELQQFRKEFKLDKIVEGAATEWEKIKRLRGWVAGSWEWFLPDPGLEDLTAWNASKILSGIARDGSVQTKGGNCMHYSIVFAQACQSFGIPARIVNTNFSIWGGHELVEVWSRDFNKWVMMDPNFDTSFYRRENNIPLNILELHQVFLDTYYPGNEVINRDVWSFEDRDSRSAKVRPEALPIAMEVGGHANSDRIDENYVWWKVTPNEANPGYSGGYGFFNTAEVRWLPRSNWLSQPLPLPVTHGRTHWGWDGYYEWTDSQTPESPEHRYFVRRSSDMYGPLFTVDFSAELMPEDTLRINMATSSPGFSHFELIGNGQKVTSPASEYRWKLASGLNKLEIRSVDVLGNRGAPAVLELVYR